MWLRDKPGGGPPQQIGMLDTVPDEETIEVPRVGVSDGFFVQVGLGFNSLTTKKQTIKFSSANFQSPN